MTLKKFPKVRPVGHPDTDGLQAEGVINVLEKMDGANFRFGRNDDQLLFGSRNHVYEDDENIPKAFRHAVDFVRSRVSVGDLREGATYFGEAMHEHTLEYDWDSVPSVLGFAVYDHESDEFKRWRVAQNEFDQLNLPTVPHVETLSRDSFGADYDIPESEYRDGVAEGVVFWHRNTTRAKLRSEEFREKHHGNTSGPEDQQQTAGHVVLVEKYCTATRIDKRIDDLLDQGHDLGRELMGEGLPVAVSRDVLEEHAHEIVGLNETVDLKEYRSRVAKKCLGRIDDRMRQRAGGEQA